MQRLLILLAFFVFSENNTLAQVSQDSLRLDSIFALKVQVELAAMDAFKNLYLVEKSGVLSRYDSIGQKSQYRFSDNRLGVPTSLDASNPLKTLVFYKNYQQCVVLDRTLTRSGTLSFADLGLGWVTAVCTAQDVGIWVFDQNTFSLKKLNPAGQIQYESQALNQLLEQSIVLEKLQSSEGRVLAWTNEGLFVFDNFGQYLSFHPLTDALAVLALPQGMVWATSEKIEWLDRFFSPLETWILPKHSGRTNVFINQKRLVYTTGKEVAVFGF